MRWQRRPMAAVIEVDLHGSNCYQAEVRINAALSRARGAYRIRVIHGYRNGTVLRDFVREHYREDPRVLRLDLSQAGSTDLVLREL